jgi:hypothetical protein
MPKKKKYFEHHLCFGMEIKKTQEQSVKIFGLPRSRESNLVGASTCSMF